MEANQQPWDPLTLLPLLPECTVAARFLTLSQPVGGELDTLKPSSPVPGLQNRE